MPDLVISLGKILTDGLPGDRPVISRIVVTYIDVVARPIQWDAVLPETGDSMVLGRLVKGITTSIVGDHCAQIFHTDIVRPRYGDVRLLDHIFTIPVVKVSIPH
jgi:hypothetical protein